MTQATTDGRSGRTARAEATAGFAAALRELRAAAGNPSFREMAGRSSAISHTTLHEAARGHKLPSWSTTAEFVKACGGDPADVRPRWDAAHEQVTAATTPTDRPEVVEADSRADIGADAVAPDDAPAPSRRRPVLLGVAGLVAAAIAVLALVVVNRPTGGSGRGAERAATDPATAQFRSADCPVTTVNPPPAPPTHPGDRGKWIGDVTVPDCSTVAEGTSFTKIWRLRNAGTVWWRGYVLHRIGAGDGRHDCQTISDVPVPTTAPGQIVDIRAEVTTPESPGFCLGQFRVFDADGHEAFPGGRSIKFQVNVA